MHSFILSCESTVDMPFSYVQERGIPVLFYAYTMNGAEHEDNMGRDPEALKAFYRDLNAGHFSQTSQINEFRYIEFFDSLLQKGDLLHIAFGSGMTASAQNAYLAADEMRKKYPERRRFSWSIRCARRPAMVCWWITPPICAMRGVQWKKPKNGCSKIGKRCIISFSRPILRIIGAAGECPARQQCLARF